MKIKRYIARDMREAIRLANDTKYGLACGIFTGDEPALDLVRPGVASYGVLDESLPIGDQVEPGDHLIVHWPCYQSLAEVPRSIGCRVSHWRGQRQANWALALEDLQEETHAPRPPEPASSSDAQLFLHPPQVLITRTVERLDIRRSFERGVRGSWACRRPPPPGSDSSLRYRA